MWPGMTELVTVSSRNEADVIAGLLESEGLQATIAADDTGGLNPEFDFTRFVRVMVADADLEKAREILAQRPPITAVPSPDEEE